MLINFNFLILFLLIPPNAIIGFFVNLVRLLNFNTSRVLFDFLVLNKGARKICSTFCFSLSLISLIECAEPIRMKF